MPACTSAMTSTPLTVSEVLDLGALTIRSRRRTDVHLLALDGELDLAGATGVEAALAAIEAAARPADSVVVDLRGLTFIDSTGLRLLIEASNRAQTATYRLRLLRPKHSVFRVCVIAGIDTLLPFEHAPGDADG